MISIKRTILGITDLKSLFQSIKSKYSIDFSNYALSSFKKRVEDFMDHYHVRDFDELIHKIENDKEFFQLMLAFQSIDTTEMFRDPEFWDELKNNILRKYKNQQEIKVWIPECCSGEELYTFQVINHQLEFSKKTEVLVTTFLDSNVDRILRGQQDLKKMEINIANFDRFREGAKLSDYFIAKTNTSIFKSEYFENVKVIQHNFFTDDVRGIFDIILFRNKMLYYNPQLKIEALKKLDKYLKPGGFISIGIKETFDYPSWENEYSEISESEKIFKKKS